MFTKNIPLWLSLMLALSYISNRQSFNHSLLKHLTASAKNMYVLCFCALWFSMMVFIIIKLSIADLSFLTFYLPFLTFLFYYFLKLFIYFFFNYPFTFIIWFSGFQWCFITFCIFLLYIWSIFQFSSLSICYKIWCLDFLFKFSFEFPDFTFIINIFSYFLCYTIFLLSLVLASFHEVLLWLNILLSVFCELFVAL